MQHKQKKVSALALTIATWLLPSSIVIGLARLLHSWLVELATNQRLVITTLYLFPATIALLIFLGYKYIRLKKTNQQTGVYSYLDPNASWKDI